LPVGPAIFSPAGLRHRATTSTSFAVSAMHQTAGLTRGNVVASISAIGFRLSSFLMFKVIDARSRQ